jgi:regulator of sirC expression with transglutaminase-like and TPR domain
VEHPATTELEALLALPERELPLDRALLLLAVHARPDLDVEAGLGSLDRLAAGVREPTLDGLVRYLFEDLGFRGNRDDYYDPDNSFLDRVVERRSGIPITLSILTMEVGRRVGVPLVGVGMPGHFLLRDQVDQGLFIDPFGGGARLRLAEVEALFHRLHGPAAPFDPALLEPTGRHEILARVLGNLRAIYAQRRDRRSLVWVLRLRSRIPGVPPAEREALADVLASLGRWDEAADELEALAGHAPDPVAQRRAADRLRARLN